MLLMPEGLSRTTHNDASIRPRDKVVIMQLVKSETVRIDEMGSFLALGTLEVTTNAANRGDGMSILGKEF